MGAIRRLIQITLFRERSITSGYVFLGMSYNVSLVVTTFLKGIVSLPKGYVPLITVMSLLYIRNAIL